MSKRSSGKRRSKRSRKFKDVWNKKIPSQRNLSNNQKIKNEYKDRSESETNWAQITKNEKYTNKILKNQEIPDNLRNELKKVKGELVRNLKAEIGDIDVRFKYAGSYQKKTMIKDSFDLDLVVYYPSTSNYTTEEVYFKTKTMLEERGYRVGQLFRKIWTYLDCPHFLNQSWKLQS